jgi:hypothetical protein
VSLQDRRDDIDAMIGARGLLRRVHDDALAPATRPPEVIVTTSGDPPAPSPGDPQGYENYKHACCEIALVWRAGMTRLTAELPAWVAEGRTPSPHEADLAVRALIPFLPDLGEVRSQQNPASRVGRRRVKGGVLNALMRARFALDAGGGHSQVRAPAPRCRTQGCSGEQQHGRYCYACVRHKTRHGELPDRVAESPS